MLPALDRYFLRELIYNLAFVLVVILAIFVTGAAVQYMHRFPELDLVLLFQALPFFLLHHLEFVVPLSLLIAVVLVYGRAAQTNEITTVKASGIHPFRVLLPGLLIAVLISLGAVHVSNYLSPVIQPMFRQMINYGKALRRIFETTIDQDMRHVDFSDYSLSWESERFPESGGLVLESVLVSYEESDEEGGLHIARASRAEVQFDPKVDVVKFRLFDIEGIEGKVRHQKTDFWEFEQVFGGESWRKRRSFMTGPELVSAYLRAREGLYSRHTPEELLSTIHQRLSLGTASLFFVLIGAPLALIFRAGGRLVAFLVAFLAVLFVYYPAYVLAMTLGEQQIVHPVLAAWSGSILLFVLGVGLLLFVVRK